MLGKQEYDGKMYFLKIKQKDEFNKPCEPYFSVGAKVDGKFVKDYDKVDQVSGIIDKVSIEKFEFDGQENYSLKIVLTDEVDGQKEIYSISAGLSILGRSLINSILSMSDEDMDTQIRISLYQNKDGFPSVSVRQNDELLPWAIKLEEIPKPKSLGSVKGKAVNDYTEVDQFFIDKVNERFGKGKSPTKSLGHAKKTAPSQVEDEDDIPF